MMLFSERHGISPQKTLQVTKLDSRTRTRILNCFELASLNSISRNVTNLKISDDKIIMFLMRLTDEYFGDRMSYSFSWLDWMLLERKIESHILEGKWYQVYDLIEFFIQKYPYQKNTVALTQCLNKVFQEENVGYRIIANQVVPIFDKGEVKEIEDALVKASSWQGVYDDLISAMKHLSDRKHPDYKDSIANSIRAVEGVAKLITHQTGTLGELMPKVQEILGLDKNFAKAIGQLWRYANNVARHADPEAERIPEFEEAKFVFVTASAIVNYLISKAQKNGIELKVAEQ